LPLSPSLSLSLSLSPLISLPLPLLSLSLVLSFLLSISLSLSLSISLSFSILLSPSRSCLPLQWLCAAVALECKLRSQPRFVLHAAQTNFLIICRPPFPSFHPPPPHLPP